MTKEELMKLLRDPDQTGQAVDELNRMIEENPYFHTGHQLYIRGLQQTNPAKMQLQLGRTALSVRDRGVLYNYLNRPSSFRQQPSVFPNYQETFIPGNTFLSPEADIHHKEQTLSAEQLMEIVRRQSDQVEPSQEIEESHTSSEIAVTDAVLVIDAVETTSTAIDAVSHVVETGLTVLKNPDVEIRTEYSEEQLIADLIRYAPPRTDVTSPAGDATVAKQNVTSNDLIDSFLKSNPKIVPDDNRTYYVDLTESLQDNQNIATETLADIYATQGHKNKAIEIYEHLILQYPEKHIYFAAQIERLKE